MNRKEFKETTEITDFCKRCLESEYHGKDVYRELWKKAENLAEFKRLVLEDERVKLKQGTAELLKNDEVYWSYLRSILGNKQFKTISDAGGLKIGNDNFSMIVPNRYGDGTTRTAILEREEFNSSAFTFFTCVEGKFNIYKYDCGDEIYCTLEGRYGIYSQDGFVVFEKWN